jgi:hypothetical protein
MHRGYPADQAGGSAVRQALAIRISTRVLVHDVEVMPVAMWHVVVPSGKAEDGAHVGGSGEDARLLAEGEGAVYFVMAACVVKGRDQVLAEDGGLE